jgi:MSHA biogenesis protein MshO
MATECAMRQMRCRRRQLRTRGVTLIEMVIVVAITAIIAVGVAVFISRPFEGYVDSARRAELTDIADTALRRMTRDLRSALPNSIRMTTVGPTTYLEYLQTSGGGRYRADKDNGGTGDELLFTGADSSFDVVGPMPPLATGDSIVIYNLAASGTIANAYSGDNRRAYSSSTGNNITISPNTPFPYPSPGKRFQVVKHAVTYACNSASGQLRRYWNYGISASQPTPPGGPDNALLADSITSCEFTYNEAGARTGVVGLALTVARDSESGSERVRLFQQVHVNNAP